MMNKKCFKECTNCHFKWDNRTSFLSDPTITLVGYQVNFGFLQAGFFLFTHETKGCGTSLAIEAGEFTDMHVGPIFEERMTGGKECPGYCNDKYSLDQCDNKCECAYVRDVLHRVKTWPKAAGLVKECDE